MPASIREVLLKLCEQERRILRDFEPRGEDSFFGLLRIVTASVANDYFRRIYSTKRGGKVVVMPLADEDVQMGLDGARPMARMQQSALLAELDEKLRRAPEEIGERDRALFRKLDIASAADGADDKTLAARLNKAIDQATATRGYVEYGEAGGWAGGVDEALDALDALDSRHDRLLFKLAERAIDRIESAIESIDDSNGECSVLLERARDLHVRAARGARPDPVVLARDLFEREIGDGYGTFDGAA